jgi:hypothetical protein
MKDIVIDYTIGNEIKQLKITFTSHGAGQIMMVNIIMDKLCLLKIDGGFILTIKAN